MVKLQIRKPKTKLLSQSSNKEIDYFEATMKQHFYKLGHSDCKSKKLKTRKHKERTQGQNVIKNRI